MKKTRFEIRQMDCAAEENLIRTELEGMPGIRHLEFDLAQRKLDVFHTGSVDPIQRAIGKLHLGERMLGSENTSQTRFTQDKPQKKLLWTVLAINFAFFLLEMTTGLLSRSMGLIADSLDMLADSFVYGISLMAVSATALRKKKVASLAGYFQLILAIIGFAEVLRRFFGEAALPDFRTMVVVSILALLANAICLYLLQRSRGKEEAHIRASLIFTSNDVIINLGVITAGLLVHWLNSGIPDLVVGTIVFLLIIRGAFRILKLGK